MGKETAVKVFAGFNIQVFRTSHAEQDSVGVFAFEAGVLPGAEKRVNS
ncbi:MAG: hypothetical protein OEM27_01530 [Nitrospinota bacterium]|nr:hypothetical protein [Nitrospinota bacterium]